MPEATGIFTPQEAKDGHLFSYKLAQYMAKLFKKKDVPVYDYGCGPGEYLRYLTDIGFKECTGVEGTREQEFQFPKHLIIFSDLSKPVNHFRRVGNVISLEVGEHIPEEFEDVFIENITKTVGVGCFLFISWAIPGQEGTGHVNCKTNFYIKNKIEKHGLVLLSDETEQARAIVENHLAYFKQTVMIFIRVKQPEIIPNETEYDTTGATS